MSRHSTAIKLSNVLEKSFTRCHNNCLLVDSCISINHDNAHLAFIKTEAGQKELKAVKALRLLTDMAWRDDFEPHESLLQEVGLDV